MFVIERPDKKNVSFCWKCILCRQTTTAKLITNDKLNTTEKIKETGNCKETEIIHAAQCFKDKVLYIDHTEEKLSECFSKHSVDIKNRPNNSEFAKHFYESHNTNDNLNITILQNNIKTAAAQNIMSTKEVLHLRWNERHLKAYLKQ